jgi:PhzF family phenazine biosynthesis protein
VTLRRTVRHVDAFTSTPLEGNPAAVVDGEGIDSETMQRIALNQHLSETVFLLPPASAEHSARLRIFTPAEELPFAGHPIVAASHVLISEGLVQLREGEALRLETGAGVIPVAVSGDPPLYTMTQVAPQFRPNEEPLDEIASWIGLAPGDVIRAEHVSTGIFWLLAQVASFEAMLRVQPDMMKLADKEISIFCVGAASPEASIRVRTFAPGAGIFEDPVTGSSNGCIAALIAKHGLLPSRDGELTYISEQGTEMGQPGRVHLRVTGAPGAMSVQVGGHAVTVLRGELLLPD